MARETVLIPASREPLYVCVGIFLAVLAYPDDIDRREDFHAAWVREHLKARAREDLAFASRPQPIRPGYFLMSDAEVAIEMRDGARRLAERKKAFIATHVLFDAAERGKEILRIEAFGTVTQNNPLGRAIMEKYWEDKNWDRDSALAEKNLKYREINKSRPVIHAIAAYWQMVLFGRNLSLDGKPKYSTDEEVERDILFNSHNFRKLVVRAELWRALAPSIHELSVGEDDLIEFRLV